MLIFWDQRLVFLATPKTGSTAIELALESLASAAIQRPSELKHIDFATFQRHVAPWLAAQAGGVQFETVTLMREPVKWLQSWYRFKLRDDSDDPQHPMTGISFADFAAEYANRAGNAANMRTQAEFVSHNGQQADRIFRYDDMSKFIEFLEDRLDCAIELPRTNVPPVVDVDLTREQDARLRQAMMRDLELYQSLTGN